jgi:hypothetical protein
MPIRINLLAEAQSAEEIRRKDPVKRSILIGVVCVAIMAVASLVFGWQTMSANRNAEGYASQIQSITDKYKTVMARRDRLDQVNVNIRALNTFAAERFLNGSLLNALQKVSADGVQLIRFRTDHSYTVTEEPRAKGNSTKPGKPSTSAEKITLVLEGRDYSASPGDQVTKFKNAFGRSEYFTRLLGTNDQMRLANLAPPTVNPATGRTAVQFTLESHPLGKTRSEIGSSANAAAPKAAATNSSSKPKSGPLESSL